MTQDPIHVALCFDDNFWAPAYATMRSACLNTAHPERMVFHLCHHGLSAVHAKELEQIGAEFGATINHYRLEGNAAFEALCRDLPTARRFPPIIYARLLLDQILPPDTGRVIYLDCDTMVIGEIADIWDSTLDGLALGAVADPWRLFNMYGRDLKEKRDIFPQDMAYFNSGMLLIDLAGFAAADIPGRLRDLARTGVAARLYYDQDMLNLIFAGNWQALDWRFNIVDPHMAHQAMRPVVLHYTVQARPWTITAGLVRSVAFARLYRHVMTSRIFYQFWRERQKRFWLGWLGANRAKRP